MERGQRGARLVAQQRAEDALGIDVDAGGEGGDRARPADVVPGGGLDGRGDQVDQRIEVGLGRAALAADGHGRHLLERLRPRPVVGDRSGRVKGLVLESGLRLGLGDFRQQSVAGLGIGHALDGGQSGGELARRNLRPDRRRVRVLRLRRDYQDAGRNTKPHEHGRR